MSHIRHTLIAALVIGVALGGCSGVAGPPDVVESNEAASSSAVTVTVPAALLGTWSADVQGTPASSGVWMLKVEPDEVSLKNPRGGDFFPLGPTLVTDHELTVRPDSECGEPTTTPTEGRYTFVVAGPTLTFTLVSDSCGDRIGILTVAPWTKEP